MPVSVLLALRHESTTSICSSTGSSRCGLFIVAYNVIAKLNAERRVDLYNAVLMARYRRSQFVSSIVSITQTRCQWSD